MLSSDNLDVMHGMTSESVDLIYLVPQFGSKRGFVVQIGSEAAGAASLAHGEEIQSCLTMTWARAFWGFEVRKAH